MRKPEEFIMAVIGVLWTILTFYVTRYSIGTTTNIALLVTVLTILWIILSFKLWQKAWLGWIWPVMLGLLVACWWPTLDHVANEAMLTSTTPLAAPWYASWIFKGIIAVMPVLLGYGLAWKMNHNRKNNIIP